MIEEKYKEVLEYVNKDIRYSVLNIESVNKKFKRLNNIHFNVLIAGIQEYNYYEILIYLSNKDKDSINHKIYVDKSYNTVHEKIKAKGKLGKYSTI